MNFDKFYKMCAVVSFSLIGACSSHHNKNPELINTTAMPKKDFCQGHEGCITKEETVKKNFTFYSFLTSLPIKKNYISLFIKSDTNNIFGSLNINDVVKAYYSSDKKLFTVVVYRDNKELKIAQYAIDESNKKKPSVEAFFKIDEVNVANNEPSIKDTGLENFYKDITKNKTIQKNNGVIHGNIESTLIKNNVPPEIVQNLKTIFKDTFYMDAMQSNGKYSILYGLNQDKVKNGDKYSIFSATFTINGNDYNLYKFGTKYYDENGESVDKFIGRVPVDYKEISSPYSLNRKHPLTGKIGHHTGVDYAATYGAAIKSTGNGVVTFKGDKRGYGNLIIIQHLNNVETYYGHISKFGKVSVGDNVKKGDLIAYVGTTGYATGPHVHFEIRKNDIPQDPATTRLVPKNKLSPKDKVLLSKTIKSYTMIEQDKKTLVAQYQ
jgi:murein DD-endopeptidase MepM/ murein hydrolase activator NlpD